MVDVNLYKGLFDNNRQAVSILHCDGKRGSETEGDLTLTFVYANQAEADLQGEPVSRIVGGVCGKLFTGADRSWVEFFESVAAEHAYKTTTAFSTKLQKHLFVRSYPISEEEIIVLTEDITNKIIAESAKQENSKYRNLFEQVQCGVTEFSVNAKGILYLDANPAAFKILGYMPEEFWRKAIWTTADVVVAEDAEDAAKVFSLVENVGDETEYKYRLRRKDGSSVWVSGSLTLTQIKAEERVYQNYFIDIDRQTKADDVLQQERLMYQGLLDETEAAVIVIDAERYEVLYGNRRALAELEKEPGTYIGSVCYRYVLGAQEPCDFCPLRDSAAVPQEHEFEMNGRIFRQVFRRVNWFGRAALVEYNYDVTEQKQLLRLTEANARNLQQMVESTKKYEEIYSTIPCGIIEYTFKGRTIKYTNANSKMLEMFGCNKEELLDGRWLAAERFSHEKSFKLFEKMFSSLRAPGDVRDVEFRMRRKDNTYIWVRSTLLVEAIDEEGIHILSAVNDEDARKKAESENDAKSRFLSRMSHEIRTPINAIMGIAELEKQDVENGTLNTDTIVNYMKETVIASKYLLRLVNDILDTSNIENKKVELHHGEVNATAYLREVERLMRPVAQESGVAFSVERKTNCHETYIGDGARVQQIVMNLLSNAFKFTPAGGSVKLIAEEIMETEDSAVLRFTVSDTGIGISEEFQQRLFIPFEQEANDNTSPYSGAGLGLSIARELTRLMGGDLVCHSVKGEGSTFIATIKVGIARQKPQGKTKAVASMEELDFTGIRVLVCEDHPLNQQITRALLERKHCAVEVAADGAIALDMFAKSPNGYYSLILMDIRMPNMDGIQAAQAIRKLDREDAATVPIVAMSANAFDADIEKSLGAGMNEHLAKPVNAMKLYKAVAHFAHLAVESAEPKPVVLVVDDVEVNRAFIAQALRHNFVVMSAENGRVALQLMNRHPDIIAVVTDIQMPEMNGVELVKALRSEYRFNEVAILGITQFGDSEQENELIGLGADDFVYKPTEPSVLATRLKNALARRKHIF